MPWQSKEGPTENPHKLGREQEEPLKEKSLTFRLEIVPRPRILPSTSKHSLILWSILNERASRRPGQGTGDFSGGQKGGLFLLFINCGSLGKSHWTSISPLKWDINTYLPWSLLGWRKEDLWKYCCNYQTSETLIRQGEWQATLVRSLEVTASRFFPPLCSACFFPSVDAGLNPPVPQPCASPWDRLDGLQTLSVCLFPWAPPF